MLQIYQDLCLTDIGAQLPNGSPLDPPLFYSGFDPPRMTFSKCTAAAVSLGRGMAFIVLAQRHLHLTFSNVLEKDTLGYLDELLSVQGSF